MNERPLIFLDIDGVLNDHVAHEGSGYCGIVYRCAAELNRVLTATDAEIVLSSAWRYMVHGGAMTLKGFEHLLCTHGVMAHNRIVGTTPTDEDRPGWTRGEQIRAWLNEHGNGRRYVVVDDMETLGIREAGHPFVITESDLGLSAADADEMIALLTPEAPMPGTDAAARDGSTAEQICRDVVAWPNRGEWADTVAMVASALAAARAPLEAECERLKRDLDAALDLAAGRDTVPGGVAALVLAIATASAAEADAAALRAENGRLRQACRLGDDLLRWAASIHWDGQPNTPIWLQGLRDLIERTQAACRAALTPPADDAKGGERG